MEGVVSERSQEMRKIIGVLFVLGFVSAPVFAQKITIDYAKEFDFDKIKTFAYHPTDEESAKDQLMEARIKEATFNQLKEGGLEQVESDPDLYVTYHLSTKENTVYNTTTMGYGGVGRGWGGWGGSVSMGTATTTATTYTMGTLILDAFDPEDKKMVWRGTGTVTLKQKPEKISKQIEKIIIKMGARWDKILRKQGE
jgi:hypothetical protein